MEEITYKEFRCFLDSDVDEAEYFGCNKDNLITMREYLLSLKERFNLCEHQIEEDKKRIEDKYVDLKKLEYANNMKMLHFHIGLSSFFLKKDEKTDIYNISYDGGLDPQTYVENQIILYKDMGNVFFKELENIENYSKQYFNKTNTIQSISSIFSLKDFYFDSLINCNGDMFFWIDKKTLIPSESTNSAFDDFHYNTDNVSVEDKQKLLTKIMVPRGFLN